MSKTQFKQRFWANTAQALIDEGYTSAKALQMVNYYLKHAPASEVREWESIGMSASSDAWSVVEAFYNKKR